jgi:tetratricopeptide (TPR) repeat protein
VIAPTRVTALALLLAGCAGAPVAPAPAERPRAGTATRTGPGEPLDERGRRLFDEAVRAREEMEKAKALDWAILERRWRAVLEAADAPEAHYNLGVTLERQGRVADARAEYQQALDARPLKQASVNLGILLERSGDLRGAQAAYDAAARLYPEDAVSRERLAALYAQSGQYDEAWHQAREALLRDPASSSARKTMIRVALARGDLDLARLVALRLQKSAADDAEVAWLSGLLLSRQGDDAGATAQWKRALALQPGLTAARLGLLAAAARHERWGEVQDQAARVLVDDPSNAPVQLLLGIAERHGGKPEEALAAYTAAEQLASGRLPEVHLARGVLLMRDKGDCDGALRAFDQYERAAGPVLPQGSPAPRLIRECQEQLEQSRAAAEAARQMKADADRKAAATAAGATARPGPAGSAEKAVDPPAATAAPGPGKGDVAPPPTSRPAPKTKP